MEKNKKKYGLLVAVALCVCLLGGFLANLAQTDFGKVTKKELHCLLIVNDVSQWLKHNKLLHFLSHSCHRNIELFTVFGYGSSSNWIAFFF